VVEQEENRDPFACPECGTVNVWNATACRDCGAEISKEMAAQAQNENQQSPVAEDDSPLTNDAPEDDARTVRPSRQPDGNATKRRWNVFWIVLGIAIHVAGVHLGVFSIIKFLVEPDPEVKATIEQTLAAARSGSAEQAALLENAKEPLKSKLQTIRGLLIFLLAAVPILIGVSAGFFSGAILDGAAAMGLSAVLIPLLNGAAEFAIIWGPANAALGALGAFLGVQLAHRFRPSMARPHPPLDHRL
jgi:hypothetical protein